MATATALALAQRRPTTEARPMRLLIAALAVFWLGLFLLLPLVAVFVEALRDGVGAYLAAVVEPDALAAIRLTLLVGRDRRAAQPRLRRRRRLGDRQVRVPRQEPAASPSSTCRSRSAR